ncbi:(2Fe-2S)-binding protein [Actinomycetota bacterium]
MRSHVTCKINGDEVEFLVDDHQTLLHALRDELFLTGTKEGCATGDCGACSVLIDGRLNCSCLVFAREVEGTDVLTVEGLADADHLHPLQQAFLEGAALQCGICTPGLLVAAKALLDRNPKPSEEEVRYAIAGNLCRCTGYDKVVRSILDAAAEMRDSAVGS